jgi:hypothetical protein
MEDFPARLVASLDEDPEPADALTAALAAIGRDHLVRAAVASQKSPKVVTVFRAGAQADTPARRRPAAIARQRSSLLGARRRTLKPRLRPSPARQA